jgi:hypothetical protein
MRELCLFLLSVVLLLCTWAAFYDGRKCGVEETRLEAVTNGAARWVADPATGAAVFEWAPCPLSPCRPGSSGSSGTGPIGAAP